MGIESVEGKRPVSLTLYTLTTCGWCKKAKALLAELGAGYDCIEVDKLSPEEAKAARETIMKWNPRCSFPTMVIDDKDCLIGYKENELREIFKDE
jgi:glutaredoxin-like protein NrdH